MRQNRSAFTLMELLVAVTIIAILVAMLVPVVGTVRDSARTAACSSNLRQIGAAGIAYATDNRGLASPTSMTNFAWNADKGRDDFVRRSSSDLLSAYLPANAADKTGVGSHLVREVFTCPQARARLRITQWASSYGCNVGVHPKLSWYAGGDPSDPLRCNSWRTVKQGGVPRPAETISLMDTCLGNGANTTTGDITFSNGSEMRDPAKQDLVADATIAGWSRNSDETASGPPRYRHQRDTSSPIAFVDGHVELWRLKQALVRNWSLLP